MKSPEWKKVLEKDGVFLYKRMWKEGVGLIRNRDYVVVYSSSRPKKKGLPAIRYDSFKEALEHFKIE